ncbi:hypothetical protein BBK14_08535 [Parafrankia soli]|uniref:non-specific serine/threonine protein kinase n=1 Tax=Parafrankia soli TaxID=2599596 RepID=A0A1S1PF18_9ACTN|nr:protein kinase [Parafrankia soli]OHV20270.1 hypothetical protein BBK14_08535 [Parafrankia soli]
MADVPPGVEPLEEGDPTEIGGYALAGRLGVGGMGTVYFGHAEDGRPVAVKVIRREYAREPEFRSRFLREARAARRVARFCTAEVLDVDTDRPEPYLVTEYIDGPTLSDLVRRGGPLPAPELERLGVAVANALTAIHSASLIHRDLKPSNILLSSSGARVIDFGIARALESSTTYTRQGLVGTPAFMAPEQALGQFLTPAVDVHAWGGVMLFASTGRMPYGDAVTPVILYRVVHEEPDLTGVGPGLHALVQDAMSKNPAARPTTADLLRRLTEGGDGRAATVATRPGARPAAGGSDGNAGGRDGRRSGGGTADHPGAGDAAWSAPDPVTRPLGADRLTPPSRAAPFPTAGGPDPDPGRSLPPAPVTGRAQPAWRSPAALVAAIVSAVLVLTVGTAVLLDPFGLRGDGTPAAAGSPTSDPGAAPGGTPTGSGTAGPGTPITLADYRDQDAAVVTKRLRESGLTVRTASRQSGTSQRGRVLDTEPPAGSSVSPGSTVLLRVGDGSQAEARGWRVFKRYAGSSPINASPIIVVNPAGTERQIGTGDNPVLAPDASRVAYTGPDGEILSVRPDGTDSRQITDEPDGSSDHAAFSPDGRTVAYTRNIGGVFLVGADGSGRRRISTVRDAYELSWSPDGTQLVFRRGNDQSLHILALDGSVRNLTGSPVPGAAAVEPAWSPDGGTIAFSTSAGGIYLISPNGGDARQVAGPGTWHPSWSPQGSLVFVQDDGVGDFFAATGPVHVMNPDGTGNRALGGQPASSVVRWAPSARQ